MSTPPLPPGYSFADVGPSGAPKLPKGFAFVHQEDQAHIEPPPPSPGFFSRIGQSLGIPTSKEGLQAMEQSLTPKHWYDYLTPGGPVTTALVKGTISNTGQALKSAFKEAKESGENIGAGQPVLPNVGKAAYAWQKMGTDLLAPVPIIGGVATAAQNIGTDVQARNWPAIAGDVTGAFTNIGLAKLPSTKGAQPTEIRGVRFPETTGQAIGKPAGMLQQTEHYLSGTAVGKPLRQVAEAQQNAARQVLADMTGNPATPARLSTNFTEAGQASRQAASPLYDSLKDIPAHQEVQQTAQSLLLDQHMQRLLNPTTKDALDNLLGATKVATNTVGEALNARSELSSLIRTTKDLSDKRILRGALNDLDNSINRGLTPQELAVRQQADLLTRRAYIQEKVGNALYSMERRQVPGRDPTIYAQKFNQVVNDLARPKKGTMPDMDVLFDNPADRQAMTQLAQFLSEKNATLQGQAGIAESMARFGVALEGMQVPFKVIGGKMGAAAHAAAYIAGLSGLSHLLANPGGALTVMRVLGGGRMVAATAGAVGRTQVKSLPLPPTPEAYHRSVIEAAKRGDITPGEADRRIAQTGGRVKVKPLPTPP